MTNEPERPSEELRRLYQEIRDMTNPLCGTCEVPYACCDVHWCHLSRVWTVQAWDEQVVVPTNPQPNTLTGITIPLLGPEGCTAKAWQCPTCSAHLCEETFNKQSDEWKTQWQTIHDRVQELEFIRLMGSFAVGHVE